MRDGVAELAISAKLMEVNKTDLFGETSPRHIVLHQVCRLFRCPSFIMFFT